MGGREKFSCWSFLKWVTDNRQPATETFWFYPCVMFFNYSIHRLTFEDVMLSDPMMGDCTNDTMMISQIDGANTFPPALCGTLTGQSGNGEKVLEE